MVGQMCWLAEHDDAEKTLYLRTAANQPWKPYTHCVQAVPDYDIPGGSKGWATYQALCRQGWTLVPSAHAHRSVVDSMPKLVQPI